MNKIIDRTKKIIFSKQQGIFSSALILSSMIIISRIFGFFRYRILSTFFVKEELDIYFASFRIPDLIFEMVITGGLTASFIPIFIKYQKDKNLLSKNISSIITFVSLVLTILILIMTLFIDKIIPLITPGFSLKAIKAVTLFTKILLLGQLPFLVIGNFLIGIGQANKRFLLSASAPIVYNLSIIITTLLLADKLSLTAPVLGVIIGAFFFFLTQLPALKDSRFQYRLIIKKTQGLIEFIRLSLPRIFTVITSQIEATIDLILASLVGPGAYTVFYLAQRLQLLPVSVIGISFGQASLPYLSEIYQDKKVEELKKIVIDSISNLFFFTFPIMSFFIFARTPIIRLFFGGPKFDWEATNQTALTLSYFAFAIPFHTIYYFLVRTFYAILDTKTPFFISVGSILINIILSILFIIILHLPVWYLGLSFAVAMSVNILILLIILSLKMGGLDFISLGLETTKIAMATLLSSVPTYYTMRLLDGLIFKTTRTINVFLLLITGGMVYFLLYLFISWFINVREIYLIGKLVLKAKEYRKKIIEIYSSVE